MNWLAHENVGGFFTGHQSLVTSHRCAPGPFCRRKILRVLAVAAMLCAICLARPSRARGQVFEVTGGSSSLLNAEGGSLTVHAEDYTARVDLGYFGKPSLGFYFSHPFQAGVLGAGDQQIPFVLPTDLFDQSFYFMARGMSFSRVVPDGRLFVFAGATSDGFFAPFLNIARTDTPSGAIFYEKELSPTLRFFS